MSCRAEATEIEKILVGGGKMGALVRSHDWSQTPLGSVENWPQSLRTALSICLNSRFPMVIWWSEELILLYNDALIPLLGAKHPQALGKPGREVWAEIWDIIGVQLNDVLVNRQATWSDDLLLAVERHGYTEEAYFTYSYSPIFLESGEVGGAFTAVTETTQRVIGERRLRTLRELAANTGLAKSVEETCRIVTATLTQNPYDIPFALLYRVESEDKQFRLVGTAGIESGTLASPQQIDLSQLPDRWNLNEVKSTGKAQLINDVSDRFGGLPGGAWEEATQSALMMPLIQSGQPQSLAGLMILGISPRQVFDDEYRGFFDLVASHITMAIAIGATRTQQSTALGAASYVEEVLRWLPEGASQEATVSATSLSQDSSPSSPRILLVNDNADMRNYVKRLLSDRYTVESVTNGIAALAAVHQQLPDLIVTDVMMPELDWYGLLRELQADPSTKWIPVILLSARAGEDSRIEGLEAGADDYLSEPFSARELLARVETNLKMAKIRQEAYRREQALRMEAETAQEQLEQVLSRIDDQFLALDREGNYVYVNDRVSQVMGIPKEELLGKNVWELFPAVANSEFYTEVQRAMAEQTIIRFDYFYPLWQRWFESRVYPSTNGVSIFIEEITDRKQVENSLKESDARLRLALKAGQMGTYDWNLQTGAIVWSEGHYALFGLNPKDVTPSYQLWAEHVHVEDLPRIEAAIQRAIEEHTEYCEEYRVRRLNNTFHWVEARGQSYYNDDGQCMRMLGVIADIDDRKQAEEILAQRETELRIVTDTIPALIAFVDADRRYRFNNRAYTDWFGYPVAELHGKYLWEVLGETAYDVIRPYVEKVLAGEFVTFESELLYTESGIRYISATYVPQFNRRGTVEGFVALVIDLSDRKQAEAALRDKELFLRNLTNNVPVLLWTALPDGTMNFVSQPWTDFTGMTLESITQQGWQAIIHPDDFDETLACWNQALQTHQPYEISHRVRRADGHYHWCISRAVLTFDDQLKPLLWVGSAVDIERQKKIELTVTQTTELLKERNQELDRFAYMVSHDLKAPLRAIANLSQWLEDDLQGQLPEENQHQMKLLRQRVYRMEALIDGLLTYSRIDRTPVEAEKVNVSQLITEIIDSLAPPPSFKIEVQPNLPTFTAKRLLLNQVLANLLSNAIKHHDRPDGRVEIFVQSRDYGYEFAVRDDGPGIDPEYHERIFNIFQTLKAKDTQDNTGIGLSIVKKIIETEGGELRLESEIGKGATFYFTWMTPPNNRINQ